MVLIKLYVPALLAIAFIIVSLRLNIKDKLVLTLTPPFLKISIPITNRVLCRLILVGLSLTCFYYYLVLDFSSFFPSTYEMDVYYDEEGIENSLSQFTEDELEEIGFGGYDKKITNIYYKDIDKRINSTLNYQGFFSLRDGIVHSHGEADFEVTKDSGFHKYCIKKAKGELTHILERPNTGNISLKSFFDLMPTSYDHLNPSFSDIFIKRRIILQPRFKQIFAENYRSDGVLFDHTLVGITRVVLFPVPTFKNTVYFYEALNGRLIPIGYAVYSY
jgi:hypothetical protein